MKITTEKITVELSIEELITLKKNGYTFRANDREIFLVAATGIQTFEPFQGKLEFTAKIPLKRSTPESGEGILPASEIKTPKSLKKNVKTDRRVDICKLDENGAETEWIECEDYDAAAAKIGCNFSSVLTALRTKKYIVHGWKVKYHVPRSKKDNK